MRIRIDYKTGATDEYPAKRKNAPKLVGHYLENPNVIKVTVCESKRTNKIKIEVNTRNLLAEFDMLLSKDYGIGLDFTKYPAISKLIEELKKYR